ncbi:MAG TPA: SDR family oxidoreductase [Polyangia bacterium]|nr:SDR family oxidoreductase [Polyangia bacterium]
MNRVWVKRVRWSASAALGWWALTRLLPRRSPLADKTALVTGGSRGLGLLIARELAKRGCRVALLARDSNELQRAVRSLRDEGWDALPLVCDVADPKQVDRALAEMVEHFGTVDVLVNDAGIIQVAPLDTLVRADFEQAMAVNFWGTVNVTLAALPYMRRQGQGRIANITSIGGKVAVPHLLPYSCAKFAAVGFSEGLRAELAGTGVRVTTVVPGLMRTRGEAHAMFKGKRAFERAWFSVAAETPGLAMSARRAARRIVGAVERGQAEIVVGIPAKMLRLAKDLLPNPTLAALAAADRALPSAPNRG